MAILKTKTCRIKWELLRYTLFLPLFSVMEWPGLSWSLCRKTHVFWGIFATDLCLCPGNPGTVGQGAQRDANRSVLASDGTWVMDWLWPFTSGQNLSCNAILAPRERTDKITVEILQILHASQTVAKDRPWQCLYSLLASRPCFLVDAFLLTIQPEELKPWGLHPHGMYFPFLLLFRLGLGSLSSLPYRFYPGTEILKKEFHDLKMGPTNAFFSFPLLCPFAHRARSTNSHI